MSYCRFSSDDFGCDAYVYEDAMGGFTIHLAAQRIIGDVPELPPMNKVGSDEFFKAYRKQMEFMDTAKREKIELPLAGETFNLDTAGECAEKLLLLRGIGYNIPQYAIDSLVEEENEIGE